MQGYPQHSQRTLAMGKRCPRFKRAEDIPHDRIGELCAKRLESVFGTHRLNKGAHGKNASWMEAESNGTETSRVHRRAR